MDGSVNWTEEFMNSQDWSGSGMMSTDTAMMENDTATAVWLTCEQRQVEFGFPLPLAMNVAIVLRYMQVAFYLICLPFGILLNLYVIVLILRFKKLQNVTFILALQVCTGDMLNAAIVFPTSAANAIADRYVFSGFCTTIGFAVFYLRIARIYLMLVLVLDRFCTVFMPFWYQRNKVKVTVPLSLVAWMWAFVISIIPVRGILDCYAFQRNTWACVPTVGCRHQNACSIYNSTSIALSNTCNIVGLVLYSILFYKARKLRNKIAIAHIEPNACSAEERAAAAQKLKRERRANITFLILFLALMGVGIPPFTFFVVGRPIITALGVLPPPAYIVAGIIGRAFYPLLTIVDPIVVMRNEDFREVSRKVFKMLIKGPTGLSGPSHAASTSVDTTG